MGNPKTPAIENEGPALQAELEESREWFFATLRCMTDAVVTSDGKGRITFLNRAAESLTGWSLSEAAGLPVGDVLTLERLGPVDAEVVSRSGGKTQVEAKSALIRSAGGGLLGVVRILRDMTERKRLETRLVQSQKMEAVTRLAGGIAHDFNNLLTAINGYTDFLHQSLGAGSPLLQNVEGIEASVDRAAKLTRQLLAFGRRQIASPRPTDLNAVIGALLPALKAMLDGKVELAFDLKKDLPPIMADTSELEQAVLILAGNAREAMPLGGTLTLATGETEYAPEGSLATGGFVLLTVADTGSGMSDVVKARLFEPFFTTKPEGKGAGLGLATVYGIVKLAGGDIQVDSEPGRGAVFRLYFPKPAVGASAPASPHALAESRSGGETILLVEDDEEVRSLIYTILKSDGYAVLQAKDGEQALRLADAHAGFIHLILTDMQMPKMGGRRLLENLLPRHPGMKAVIMSGYSPEDVPAPDPKLPVSFLEKPFMPKSMIRQIRKVLDG